MITPGTAEVTALTAILVIEVRGRGINVDCWIANAAVIAADSARMIGSAVLENPLCFLNLIR